MAGEAEASNKIKDLERFSTIITTTTKPTPLIDFFFLNNETYFVYLYCLIPSGCRIIKKFFFGNVTNKELSGDDLFVCCIFEGISSFLCDASSFSFRKCGLVKKKR